MTDFGNRLKQARKEKHMTQKELAKRLGLEQSAISNYEKSFRTPPMQSILDIAEALEVSVSYLLGETLEGNRQDLGKPQYLEYLTYLDCKKRTKKQVGLCDKDKNDEVLVRTILANSSIVEHENERSYSRVYDAVDLICKQLCPGQWCDRCHCEHYSSVSAWNCCKTRPKVCKEYAKYIAKKEERE